MMTSTDKRNLVAGTVLAIFVTLVTMLSVFPKWNDIVLTILPVTLLESIIASIGSALLFSIISPMFYREGNMDRACTTKYFYFQSPLEEIIVRFNSVLIVRALDLSFWGILLVCIIQAIIFFIIHLKDRRINQFFFALIWFILTYLFGILPAMVGHLVANLSFRRKIRKEQGWL